MAERYAAELGLHVFPVAPDCRQPLTKHGYKDASAVVCEVSDLWAGRENANIAIATGVLGSVFVLDVDRKSQDGYVELKRLINGHGPLPLSWRSDTPSGGCHLYFEQPKDRALRNKVGFRPGLDIRTTGGSSCAPPSERGEGGYAWVRDPFKTPLMPAPSWLLEVIDPPPPPRAPSRPLSFPNNPRATRYLESALSAEIGRVRTTSPRTGRNQQLFMSSASLGEIVAAGLLPSDLVEGELFNAAMECGLVRDDGPHSVRATIASGFRAGALKPRSTDFGNSR